MAPPKTVAAWILAAGFATALVIYVTASPPEGSLADGPETTKQHLREMEVYGGSANVLASEFRQWFAGLWHGRQLAFTVAGLSVLTAGFALIQLTSIPTDAPPSAGGSDGGDRTRE